MLSPFDLSHWHLWAVLAVIVLVVLIGIQQFVLPALRLRHALSKAIACLQDLQGQDSVAVKAALDSEGIMTGHLASMWARYARTLQLSTSAANDTALGAARLHVNRLSRAFFSTLHATTDQDRPDLNMVERMIENDDSMANLWTEYQQALETLGRLEAGTQTIPRAWQASAPAELFFPEQLVVDSALQADFFRHVPGILTGAGIIGTFAGLILGLVRFDVSDPQQVQVQLSLLVQAVGQAFMVSALAIGLAMVFTWTEKSLLSARYRQVEQLQQLLDTVFWPRGGTEQIERLTRAVEIQTALSFKLLDELRQQPSKTP